MIDEIRKNIEVQMNILREISAYYKRVEFANNESEKKLLFSAIRSLQERMKILNDSIPSLLHEVSAAKSLPNAKTVKKDKFEKVDYKLEGGEIKIIIRAKDKKKLLKELSIGESYIKKLKKGQKKFLEEYHEFKAARGYLKLANKFFLKRSQGFIEKGYFKGLSKEIRKANLDVLLQGYISMMLLTVFLSFILSIFLAVFLIFFEFNLSWLPIGAYKGEYSIKILKIFWIPFFVPVITFLALYYYPTTEKYSLSKKINQELPFAVIHMNAISGSGIEPSEIFRIIGLSREYPHLRKEIRKVLNQINLYGYDLVTALNNAAASTPSEKLAELLFGLATTINSGGSFSEFFEKRAETLLSDYRLERQKYSKNAETFMDIYISVVIAAPMILMLFLILLTLGSFDIGLSIGQMTFLMVAVITLINVFFLIFIHFNQPSY